ncbi:hypothetical protein [Microbacterium sp. HJ5]
MHLGPKYDESVYVFAAIGFAKATAAAAVVVDVVRDARADAEGEAVGVGAGVGVRAAVAAGAGVGVGLVAATGVGVGVPTARAAEGAKPPMITERTVAPVRKRVRLERMACSSGWFGQEYGSGSVL